MLYPVILLVVASLSFVNGQAAETRIFKPDINYWYSKWAYAPLDYVAVDGKKIAKATTGTNCDKSTVCWQKIKSDQYFIATGPLKGSYATVTVQPPAGSRGKLLTFVYKEPCEDAPKVDGEEYYKQEVEKGERILHAVVFSEPPGRMTFSKNVVADKRENDKITLLGMTGFQKHDHVLFTGHLTSTPKNTMIYFKNGQYFNITIQPEDSCEAISPVVTFVDTKTAFK